MDVAAVSKEIKSVSLLRQRPLVRVNSYRWTPATVPFVLSYIACFLKIAWCFLDGQW